MPEPPYTILQEPATGHPDFLVAEIHLPEVVCISDTFFTLFAACLLLVVDAVLVAFRQAHRNPFSGLFSRTTWLSRHQKG